MMEEGLSPDESPGTLSNGLCDRIARCVQQLALPSAIKELPWPWAGQYRYPLYNEVKRILYINRHPQGYPQLAALFNSDEVFQMCRRFGFLQHRVLLYRQDELRGLEEQLIKLDNEDKKAAPIALMSRALDDARYGSHRKELIQEIDYKLNQYSDAVKRIHFFSSCKVATSRDHYSLDNWIDDNFESEAAPEDSQFIHHKSDLVMLPDVEERGRFETLLGEFLSVLVPYRFGQYIFSSAEQRRLSTDGSTRYYSRARIGVLVRLVICLLVVALLMVPVVILLTLQTTTPLKITVVVVSSMLFTSAMSIFTRARKHELFAATAAYCAVLTVFLGNIVTSASDLST